MKTITINIAEGGIAISNDTELGRAGEHNNTSLHIVITDAAMLDCDYFRCWLGNKYTKMLTSQNGQLEYTLPQDVLTPPTVDFTLCGYKLIDGEICLVARSSTIVFSVEESAYCAQISDTSFEPYEIISLECGNSANAAKQSELSAKAAAEESKEYSENALEALQEYDELKTAVENKADKSELSELESTYLAHITQLQTEVGKKADKSAVEDLEIQKMDKVMGSEGQYASFDGISPKINPTSPDTAPTQNSNKLITSGAVYSALDKKLDIMQGFKIQYLGFNHNLDYLGLVQADEEPTKNSEKLITSGAVYTAIGNIESALDSIIAMQNELIGGDAE